MDMVKIQNALIEATKDAKFIRTNVKFKKSNSSHYNVTDNVDKDVLEYLFSLIKDVDLETGKSKEIIKLEKFLRKYKFQGKIKEKDNGMQIISKYIFTYWVNNNKYIICN